jgi:hypothetical protein
LWKKTIRAVVAIAVLLISIWAVSNLINNLRYPDGDSDGLRNSIEEFLETNPWNKDTDGDGIEDGKEYNYWRGKCQGTLPTELQDMYPSMDAEELLSALAPNGDLDLDGFSNICDYDSDNDGITDGEELRLNIDPASPDTDKDGLSDSEECTLGTNLSNPDTDGDGICDGKDETPCGENGWKNGVLECNVVDPEKITMNPCRDGSGEDTLVCCAVFDPYLGDMKRLVAVNSIDENYSLHISNPSLHEIKLSQTHRGYIFTGRVTLDLEMNKAVSIPSVAPDAEVLEYETEPTIPLTFFKDGADNFYVKSNYDGKVELRFKTTSDDTYFNPDIPEDLTLDDVPSAVKHTPPALIRSAAASIIEELGLSGERNLKTIIAVLKDYFSSFTEGMITPVEEQPNPYLAMAESKHGSCYVRSYAFFVTANSLGVPTRVVTNECHAFVEVYVPTCGWKQVNLGGLGTYEIRNPNKYKPFAPLDSDGDKIPDDWENDNGLNPFNPADAHQDIDRDELNNFEEYQNATNPCKKDTDEDGLDDKEETTPGEDGYITDPTNPDSDNDGLNDKEEYQQGSNPNNPESSSSMIPTFVTLSQVSPVAYKAGYFDVKGSVEDQNHNPVADMTVEIFVNKTKSSKGDKAGEGKTNVRGRFIIRCMVPDDAEVGINHVVAHALNKGLYLESWSDPLLEIYSNTTLTLSTVKSIGLNDELKIKGSLLDASGKPLDRKTIEIYWDESLIGRVLTDSNGVFYLEYKPRVLGTFNLAAVYEGDEYLKASTSTMFVTVKDVSTRLEFEVTPTSAPRGDELKVKGKLYTGLGVPISNVSISLFFDEKLILNTTTSTIGVFQGRFIIPMDSSLGDAYVEAYYAGSKEYAEIKTRCKIIVQAATELTLDPPAQRKIGSNTTVIINGMLYDDLKQPLENLSVTVYFDEEGFNVTTNSKGRFNLTYLVPPSTNVATVKGEFSGYMYYLPSSETMRIEIISSGGGSKNTYILLTIAAGVCLLSFIGGVIMLFRKRKKEDEEMSIEEVAERTIERLRTEKDYRKTVLDCYKQMCDWLRDKGVDKNLDYTPREFEQAINNALKISREKLSSLTEVFEKARYSNHEITVDDKDKAIESLREIMGSPF